MTCRYPRYSHCGWWTLMSEPRKRRVRRSITASRSQYCKPEPRKTHKLQLQSLKFDAGLENSEDLPGTGKNKNKTTLPRYIDWCYHTCRSARRSSWKKSVAVVQVASKVFLRKALNETNRSIKEIVTNGMPNFSKRKKTDREKQQQYNVYVQWLESNLPFTNYGILTCCQESQKNELSLTLPEGLIGASTERAQQGKLKHQQADCSNRINTTNTFKPTNQNYKRKYQPKY